MIKDCARIGDMAKINEEIRKCRRCRLHRTRTNAVPGEGPSDADIMICGQAPGRAEDIEGRPFVGMAGKFLSEMLESIELERERLFITSSTKCFPPGNRPPKSDELKACRPHLERQIRLVKPKVIIALGNYAVQTLLDRKPSVSQLHGKTQGRNGIVVFATFHPAAAMRFPKVRGLMTDDFRRLKDLLIRISA